MSYPAHAAAPRTRQTMRLSPPNGAIASSTNRRGVEAESHGENVLVERWWKRPERLPVRRRLDGRERILIEGVHAGRRDEANALRSHRAVAANGEAHLGA